MTLIAYGELSRRESGLLTSRLCMCTLSLIVVVVATVVAVLRDSSVRSADAVVLTF